VHFGLIANIRRVGARETIESFQKWVRVNNHKLTITEELREAFSNGAEFAPHDKICREVDVLVAMGGDGTILSGSRSIGSVDTPMLGINLGSLGFLSPMTPKQLIPALDAIAAGNYNIEERMMLKAEIEGHAKLPTAFALNEIAIDNGRTSRVLSINLRINNEDVVTYTADGLLISTPTGSTAYNLAVGGPIVSPGLDAMIAAPVASFALTTRPMIISGKEKLEATVISPGRTAMITFDGQTDIEIKSGERIYIKKANFKRRLIVFPENSYFQLLRNKLNWGVPPNFEESGK